MQQLKPSRHLKCMPQLAQAQGPQLGIALLEALVALLILVFGLLGLLWMHQQALGQQRQQLMRSVSIGIADDLVERMHLNPPQPALYAKAWGTAATRLHLTAQPRPAPAKTLPHGTCNSCSRPCKANCQKAMPPCLH
jgi:Tfp pilus assembly protein PilV